jgi:hypothetical protein
MPSGHETAPRTPSETARHDDFGLFSSGWLFELVSWDSYSQDMEK